MGKVASDCREVARKPRLDFAGAIYNVLSRGNYRKELFDAESARLFEKTLFEACGKCGWLLHAYVIMRNHYHLAGETPEGNLVEGMRWLQGTFGIRFNAVRGERGHVFQSRYKSLVIEEGRPLPGEGSGLASVQLAFQVLDFSFFRGSKDVDRATHIAA